MTERPENYCSQWPSCRISLRTDTENERYTNSGKLLSHKKCWYMSFRKHGIGLETMIRPTCFFLICDLDFKPVMKTAGGIRTRRKGTRGEKEV